MAMIYNPSARANDFHVIYMVNATGDRWFIPYNKNSATSDQVTRCDVIVGDTADGTPAGSATVAS
tara:strand:+ start:1016 stop:1210 length:195 start_codon:yes stop_codon:yes gene_type:complete